MKESVPLVGSRAASPIPSTWNAADQATHDARARTMCSPSSASLQWLEDVDDAEWIRSGSRHRRDFGCDLGFRANWIHVPTGRRTGQRLRAGARGQQSVPAEHALPAGIASRVCELTGLGHGWKPGPWWFAVRAGELLVPLA